MPVMLGGGSSEKLSRCYLGDQLLVGGQCQKILTFDFQNDGTLGWTYQNPSSSYRYGYTSGQGFYMYSTGGMYGLQVQMPESSWQSGKLVKVRLRGTRPNNKSSIGFDMYGYQNMIRFGGMNTNNIETCVNNDWTNYSANLGTGESEYVIILNDDGSVNRSALGTSGTFTKANLVQTFRNYRNQKSFLLHFSSWSGNAIQYIRKCEITLE